MRMLGIGDIRTVRIVSGVATRVGYHAHSERPGVRLPIVFYSSGHTKVSGVIQHAFA